MFDHDNFINKTCQSIFGRPVLYKPRNKIYQAFYITGDFHEAYVDINLKNSEADISSAQTVLIVRLVEFGEQYPLPFQGDIVVVDELSYHIVDVQPHIPGSKKLILHEDN